MTAQPEEVSCLQQFLDFFNAIPIPLVVIVSAFIAYYSIRQARVLHTQKNTIDFSADHANNESLLAAYAFLHETTNNQLTTDYHKILSEYATTNRASKEAASLRLILNTWERISRGIEDNIYNEEMLYKAYKSTALAIYEKTSAFRKETQKGRPTCFECFEKLGANWKRKYKKEGGNYSIFY